MIRVAADNSVMKNATGATITNHATAFSCN
jgi:hypothetical protein